MKQFYFNPKSGRFHDWIKGHFIKTPKSYKGWKWKPSKARFMKIGKRKTLLKRIPNTHLRKSRFYEKKFKVKKIRYREAKKWKKGKYKYDHVWYFICLVEHSPQLYEHPHLFHYLTNNPIPEFDKAEARHHEVFPDHDVLYQSYHITYTRPEGMIDETK